MTEFNEEEFHRHKDALVRLFAKVVVDWAEANNKQGDIIEFALAIEYAYMVGAVITARTSGQTEKQVVELAKVVCRESM
jgi:hypothetical protein